MAYDMSRASDLPSAYDKHSAREWCMSGNNGIRVALATCHDKHNYGSMLQAWATQEFLEGRGFDVRTIDKAGLRGAISVGRRGHYARHAADVQMYAEKAPFALHGARQRLSRRFGREMGERHAAFEAFARDRFRLTRRAYSFDEARELSAEYDALVVGSDQLWLPVNVAGDYFTLSWVASGVRKVAYATSFGLSELDGWTSRRVGEFLPGYHAVSVREESGADIVEKVIGRRPEVVCDPTMLLDASRWREVAASARADAPGDPYVLAYFLGRNAWQREAVRELADARGLKVVAVAHNDSYVRADEGYADLYPWDAGPAEWVRLIDGAELVCTDSFHGTLFSSVLGTPFVSFRRHSEGAQSTNSRLDTLLGTLGLEDRLCRDPGGLGPIADAPIDFAEVGARVAESREASARWLVEALSFPGRGASRHIEVYHREDCCGCGACASACPVDCVEMTCDAEGCEYPRVDESACVGCGRCVGACPVINRRPERERPQEAFLVQHRDPRVLLESTSGGAMTALAQAVIEGGGVVFGAGFLDEGARWRAGDAPGRLAVGHFGVEDESELRRFRNSKYVQSSVGPAYREVREELARGREVLFTGTPCQCEGLIAYLGSKPEGLRLADVVCHAIVCRAAFSSYVGWLEGRVGPIDAVRFRDKARYGYGYSSICAVARGEDGSEGVPYGAGVESDPYLRAFFGNLSDRPICYVCPFKKRYRESDLTCWDCFDPSEFGSALDNNGGVTRVLVHSAAGRDLLDRASRHLAMEEVDADAAVAGVREMTRPVDGNPGRARFMRDVVDMDPDELVAKWLPDSLRVKAMRVARRVAQRTGKYDQVKRFAKRVLGR